MVTERLVVIDGSNVLRHKGIGKGPGVENLRLVLEELRRRGYANFYIFIDESTYRKWKSSMGEIQKIAAEFGARVDIARGGLLADDYILDKASRFNALILTNDQFKEEKQLLYQVNVEERRIGFDIVSDEAGTRVLLEFPDVRSRRIPTVRDVEKYFQSLTGSELRELTRRTLRQLLREETEYAREEFLREMEAAGREKAQSFQRELTDAVRDRLSEAEKELRQRMEREEFKRSIEEKVADACRDKLIEDLRPRMWEAAKELVDRAIRESVRAGIPKELEERIARDMPQLVRPIIEKESRALAGVALEQACRGEEAKSAAVQTLRELVQSPEFQQEVLGSVEKAILRRARELSLSDAPQLKEEARREAERVAEQRLENIAREAAKKAVAEELQRLRGEGKEVERQRRRLGDVIQNLNALLNKMDRRLDQVDRLDCEVQNLNSKLTEVFNEIQELKSRIEPKLGEKPKQNQEGAV
jgi:hypothetical protein